MERLRNKGRFLTLNIHSHMELDSERKRKELAKAIAEQKFDVIALQEVNQSILQPRVSEKRLQDSGFMEGERDSAIKEDNYGLLLAEDLRNLGLSYYWTWAPSHIGYGRFDEGLSLFCLQKVLSVKTGYISSISDYKNPCARKVIGIKPEDGDGNTWFYSVHLSRWLDQTESFQSQWEALEVLADLKNDPLSTIWIMGDFNNPAEDVAKGYSYILQQGIWKDCYSMAASKEGSSTVLNIIDGWRDVEQRSMRMDYIMVNQSLPIFKYSTIFDGKFYPVVSDHFGVMVIIGTDGKL